MTDSLRRVADQAHPGFPVTIYYAFKQSERKGDTGIASTGWEAFLDGAIQSGFTVTGTWPMHTERRGRMRDFGSNALASSIVLVCRRRPADAPSATRRECVTALRVELPPALRLLQTGNIAPVDLAQAAIGPGMAVYTRYAKSFRTVPNEAGHLTGSGGMHRLPRVRPRSTAAPRRRQLRPTFVSRSAPLPSCRRPNGALLRCEGGGGLREDQGLRRSGSQIAQDIEVRPRGWRLELESPHSHHHVAPPFIGFAVDEPFAVVPETHESRGRCAAVAHENRTAAALR